LIKQMGLAGEVRETAGDYLMMVDTNIGGAKSDGVMKSDVKHVVAVQPDGSLNVTVTMTKTHEGIEGDPFTGRVQADYFRMYVPKGARLVSAEGFTPPSAGRFKNPAFEAEDDLDLRIHDGTLKWDDHGMMVGESFGKTVFANWIQIAPRQTVTIAVSYVLPFRLDDLNLGVKSAGMTPYTAVLQRQSGVMNRSYEFSLVLPDGRKVAQGYPVASTDPAQTWKWSTPNWLSDQLIRLDIE